MLNSWLDDGRHCRCRRRSRWNFRAECVARATSRWLAIRAECTSFLGTSKPSEHVKIVPSCSRRRRNDGYFPRWFSTAFSLFSLSLSLSVCIYILLFTFSSLSPYPFTALSFWICRINYGLIKFKANCLYWENIARGSIILIKFLFILLDIPLDRNSPANIL